MSINDKILLEQFVSRTVAKLYPLISLPKVELTRPEDEAFGDYTSSLALRLAGTVKQAPMPIASAIVEAIEKELQNEIESKSTIGTMLEQVEAIAPGFINFRLKSAYLLTILNQGYSGQESTQESKKTTGQTILFEFGTPNTHKMPHIGHLFSYVYGESCARLLEAKGEFIIRNNYQGDVGLHVAKCLWALRQSMTNYEQFSLTEKIDLLQKSYQEGSLAYDEDPASKQEIDQLNTLIYQQDSTIVSLWQETRSWSIEYYRQFEERLGINHRRHYYESETNVIGKKVVTENLGKIFETDDGAIIFRGEKFGLHTRVFVNQLGNPTYEAKDIGLITKKMIDFPDFDLAIVTTANEQNEYYKIIMQVSKLIYPDLTGRMYHLGHGMINLSTGKMSSRTGQIITAFSLVELVKSRVKDYLRANRQVNQPENYSENEIELIAEKVALGAIKYSFLRSSANKNISFDLESSIAFDGNSGPYLMYTFARCQSLLSKSRSSKVAEKLIVPTELNPEELAIIRSLNRFEETVALAADNHAPHLLAGYLFELAQRFSYFYNQHQIIDDNKITSNWRLGLTRSVSKTLGEGLRLLGIEVLDRI